MAQVDSFGLSIGKICDNFAPENFQLGVRDVFLLNTKRGRIDAVSGKIRYPLQQLFVLGRNRQDYGKTNVLVLSDVKPDGFPPIEPNERFDYCIVERHATEAERTASGQHDRVCVRVTELLRRLPQDVQDEMDRILFRPTGKSEWYGNSY